MAAARSGRWVDQPIPAHTGIRDSDALQRATAWLDERFGLATLWLFRSAATGTATENSDIDLAALFQRHPSAVELLEAQEELSRLLGRAAEEQVERLAHGFAHHLTHEVVPVVDGPAAVLEAAGGVLFRPAWGLHDAIE